MTSRRPALGPTVTLAHGGGGKAMHDLIDEVFVRRFGTAGGHEDQARIPLTELQSLGDRLAFTTDSCVIDPLFFPGGDIGSLAVNGTINDLAMGGAVPVALSCAIIAEEGLPIELLERVAESMQRAAQAAGVPIVTGDTKVVNRGAADKLFINTSGIGVIGAGIDIRAERACVGDCVLVSGFLGDHSATILNARGDLALDAAIQSDTQALHGLVQAMRGACPDIHCLRDATHGGLATVLNEFARAASVRIEVLEEKIIGEVTAAAPPGVTLRTRFGGDRIVDMLIGEQLPRIC